MNPYLKGNYPVSDDDGGADKKNKTENRPDVGTREFERRAVHRLGGSIAFVIKKDTFVWDGSPAEKSDAPPSPPSKKPPESPS